MASEKHDEIAGLWPAEDVAKVLRCEPRTVRRKTKTDGLPFVRTGSNRMLFDPAAIRNWIAARSTILAPIARPGPALHNATLRSATSWDGVKRSGRSRA